MDPLSTFCTNPDCPARGQSGKGNITIHSQEEQRYRCTVCGQTKVATFGTFFYRLHVDTQLAVWVVGLVANGCPISAIHAVFGFDPRTVRSWIEKAGVHCEGVHDHLIAQPADHPQIQFDELRVKRQGGIVWVGSAISVRSRLWLGASVSAVRDSALAFDLVGKVKRCCRKRPLLFTSDGWKPYVKAIRRHFREPEREKKPGRPRLIPWSGVAIGQVVKRYAKRRVVAVERRRIQGSETRVKRLVAVSQRLGGVLNTAFIERLNATFRSWLPCLVRRTRGLARRMETIVAGVYLIGSVYNFCTAHDSLGSRNEGRTPAMAAGITDHQWSLAELLSYRVPPPRWVPPKRRGRKSKALLALIQRWAM